MDVFGNMVQGKSGVESYKNPEKVNYSPDQWIVVSGTHEPIIAQDVWDSVQALIAKKATPGVKEPEGIFARKVRCIHCGYRLRSTKSGNRRGFKCDRHTLSPDACVGAYISLRKLERIVVAELHTLSQELLDEERLEQEIDPFPDLREKKEQMEVEISLLRQKIADSHASMRTLYMKKIKGAITESEYIDLMIEISDEKNGYENQVTEYSEQIAQIDKALAIHCNRKLLVQQYVESRSLTKDMVDILIDQILVGKRDPVTKETPVEIHWNF